MMISKKEKKKREKTECKVFSTYETSTSSSLQSSDVLLTHSSIAVNLKMQIYAIMKKKLHTRETSAQIFGEKRKHFSILKVSHLHSIKNCTMHFMGILNYTFILIDIKELRANLLCVSLR